MSSPRILGVLNNCAVNVAVLEITRAIASFAADEKQIIPALKSREAAYLKLKALFAEYHGIPNLTWKEFHCILTTGVNDNQTAAQLMLGPVLREFMKFNGAREEIGELQNAGPYKGRYQSLDMGDVQTYLYGPLGVKLNEFRRTEEKGAVLNDEGYQVIPPEAQIAVDEPFAVIDVYNEGNIRAGTGRQANHWERVPENKIGSVVNDDADLPPHSPIRRAHEEITGSDSKAGAEYGLSLLKDAVKSIHRAVNNPAPIPQRPEPAERKREIAAQPTINDIAKENAQRAAEKYEKHLRDQKIDAKPEDIKSKKENVKNMITDLFNANLNPNKTDTKVEQKKDETPADFAKRQKQILDDEKLAKEEQEKEIRRFRPR